MKTIKFLMLIFFSSFLLTTAQAQGFKTPAEGNAAIYFVRVSSWGSLTSFEYFRNEEFIGVFKGKNYMRFEYPAGKQLFWASSEDKEFLECDLQAGKIYVVLVNIEMGAWKARIGLEPVTSTTHKAFDRIINLVNEKNPVVTSQAKIDKTKRKLARKDFVNTVMDKYNTIWKGGGNIKQISADMFMPIEALKLKTPIK